MDEAERGGEAGLVPPLVHALELAESWVGRSGAITTSEIKAIVDEVALTARMYAPFLDVLEGRGHRIVAAETDDDDEGDTDIDGPWQTVDGLSTFLRASEHDVLDYVQEQELARAIDRGRLAEVALAANAAPEESRPALEQLVRRGSAAREDFLLHNVRLVISIAKRYQNQGMELDDLIQEGLIGLERAVDKFDADRGFKFSTYATWWVRQAVTRAIADKSRSIRIPVHMFETMKRVSAIERTLHQTLGRSPTAREIGATADLPLKTILLVREIRSLPVSLDLRIGADSESALGDFVPANAVDDPARAASAVMLHDELERTLDEELDERERDIIRHRFGFCCDRAWTLEELGEKYGVTRERIRQIESRTLEKLRQPARCGRLRDYLMEFDA